MQKLTFINSRGQSIELNSIPPYILSKMEGLGDVSAENQTQKAPFQDGSTYINTMLEERVISLEVSITQTGSTISEARQTFASIFNPKLGPGLLQYVYGDMVKEIEAVPEHVPVFPGGSNNRSNDFQTALISLKCPNPFWRTPSIVEEPMAAFVELFEFSFEGIFELGIEGHTRTFTNNGDTEVPIKIKINGPTTNPTLTNLTTGEFIKVNRELLAGDGLEISTEAGNKYVRVNGTNAFNWIDLSSAFWKLAVGDNDIEYTADSGRESATLTIEWQERYNAV